MGLAVAFVLHVTLELVFPPPQIRATPVEIAGDSRGRDGSDWVKCAKDVKESLTARSPIKPRLLFFHLE